MKKYRTIPRIFTIYITEISYSAPQNVMRREWISSVPKNIYSHAERFEPFAERFITVPYRGAGIFAAKTPNDTAEYYVRDPHGSTVRTVKADGTTVAEYEYDAFGKQLTNTDTDNANPFLYCGEYYDEETGLIYLRNRYYDPSTGRFITEDPAKDGMNWYVYCDNNPVNLWDSLGLDSYIIYDVNGTSGDGKHTFEDEAKIKQAELENTWGTPVHLLPVSNAKEFKAAWNYRVGYDLDGNDVSVEEVYIIAHGSASGNKGAAQGYFMYTDGSKVAAKESYKYSDVQVSDLAWKKIEHLNFSVCNSGNPDIYNLAYGFKIRMTIGWIHAWDGGTVFDYKKKRLLRGGYDSGNWKKDIRGQGTWYNYVDKNADGSPVRRREGYRCIVG